MDRRIAGCTSVLEGGEKLADENRALVHGLRGGAYLAEDNDAAALADFEKCIELAPLDTFCWSSKALVYSKRGQLDEVISTYTALADILQKGPQSEAAKASLVMIAYDACQSLTARADKKMVAASGSASMISLPPNADKAGVEKAISDLSTCLSFAPYDSRALGKRALFAYLLGRRAPAVADAEKAREDDPHNSDALAVLALTAFDDEDYSRSLEFSQLWHKYSPDDANAELQFSKVLKALGRLEEADALAVSRSRANCMSATSAVSSGNTAMVDNGIRECTKAIEAAGGDPATLIAPHEFRAFLRGLKRDYEGAVADYTRAIELSGGSGEYAAFYIQRGMRLADLSKRDLAIADFDAALKELPQNKTALAARASTHADLGQFDKAKADFARLREIDVHDPRSYAGLADVAHQTRSFDEAIAHYTKLIELRPDLASAYHARGLSFEQLGQREQAISDFRTAVSMNGALKESADALKRLEAQP